MTAMWKRNEDPADGVWWEADIHLGSTSLTIMVDEDGYTITEGGGSTIADVVGQKGRRGGKGAKIRVLAREAVKCLKAHLVRSVKVCDHLRTASHGIKP